MQKFVRFLLLVAISLFSQCDGLKRKIFIDDNTHTFFPNGISRELAKSDRIDEKFWYYDTNKKYRTHQLVIHAAEKESPYPGEKMRMAQRGVIRNFVEIDELIVSREVPDRYFLNLEGVPSAVNLKHLTLYKYKGNVLKNPCKIFPNLISLIIEQTDITGSKWDLSLCSLRRLTVRAVPAFKPLSSPTMWDLLDQFTDFDAIKSQEESAWDLFERPSFYIRKKQSRNLMESALMKYSVIEAALKTTLDYLEVAPCTDAFFVKVMRKVDKKYTITHLNFGTYDFVGPIAKPYFYIYDMSKPPPGPLQSKAFQLLIASTELGLKFDTGTLSNEWRAFLLRFTKLKTLRLDCHIEILINMEQMLQNGLTNLATLTVIVAEKDMSADKRTAIVENSRKFVDVLSNKVLKIRTITGLAPFDVPSCTSIAEPKNGRMTVTYTCNTT